MLSLPPIDDLHVHLRQDELMRLVVPSIKTGGVDRVLVMPNLGPPITTVQLAVDYHAQLTASDPEIDFLMTLFLSPSLTVDEVRKAAEHKNIVGVKSYPKGVTTGSDCGVEDYQVYFPVFSEMEKLGLSLHLHGEVPGACVMQAEEKFLTQLDLLHEKFPRLKIVLEHVTTEAAVSAVLACGPTVAATITVHHIDLTISDVVGNNLNFCKPVAKLESDRNAIRAAVRSGNPKFFFGSDSAPHLSGTKAAPSCCPAGIFTQPFVAQYLADVFDRLGCLDKLKDFACTFGQEFLNLPPKTKGSEISLRKENFTVPPIFGSEKFGVVPFRAGQSLMYK